MRGAAKAARREEDEEAKVGETREMGMRAKVRGDVWVNRLTAGKDMIVLRKKD